MLIILTGPRLCGVRFLATDRTDEFTARSVNSFDRPTETSFAIRRFVEESVDMESEPEDLASKLYEPGFGTWFRQRSRVLSI